MKKQLMIIGIIVILLTVGFSGCSEQTEQPSNGYIEVIINSFKASETTIYEVYEVTLTWDVVNADTVKIDNNIGEVPLTGSYKVQPTETTTYKLTASYGTQKKYASIEIIVKQKSSNTEKLKGTWRETNEYIWKFMENYVLINSDIGNETYYYYIEDDKLYIPGYMLIHEYYTMNWIDDNTLHLTGWDVEYMLYRVL